MESTWPSHTFAGMVNRVFRFTARLAAACLLTVLMSGVGHLALNPGGDASSEVGRAVSALTEGRTVTREPEGFEEAMGYQLDRSAKPDGSCSAPAAYRGFAGACKTHDLGYDLLRFASRSGEPLGPWARLGIDHRFHRDMLATCGTFGCHVLSHVYGLGVVFNSIRQGFTSPTEEPPAPWAMLGVLTVATASISTSSVSTAGTPGRVEGPVPAGSHA